MTFAAYQSRHDGTDFSYEGRDESAGILGIFRPNNAAPVVTAHTLEELERKANAHLGKEPDAFLYLTDVDGHVYRIMINAKYHATVERANRRTAISVVLVIFSTTCLIGASLGSLGALALLGFVGVTVLYALILRAELFNEIEGAVACELLLILALLLIPLLQRFVSSAA
jgi:hypothetical protein